MIDIRAQCVGMYADMGGCVSDVHMWVLPFPLTFSTNQPLEKINLNKKQPDPALGHSCTEGEENKNYIGVSEMMTKTTVE